MVETRFLRRVRHWCGKVSSREIGKHGPAATDQAVHETTKGQHKEYAPGEPSPTDNEADFLNAKMHWLFQEGVVEH